jgi:hypothetical protein
MPGTLADAVVAPVITAGPVQAYPVTLVGLLAVSVSVLLAHSGALLVIPVIAGAAFTEIVVPAKHPPGTI